MKKIIFYSTGLGTGGAEKMLLKIIRNMDRDVYSPVVVSLIDHGTVGSCIEALGVRVYCLNMNTIKGAFLSLFRLWCIARKEKADIVQGWMYHGNLFAFFSWFFSPKKTRLFFGVRHTLYDLLYEKRLTRFVIIANRYLARYTDGVIFNSAVSLEKHREFGFSGGNFVVIPNGFDVEHFCPDSDGGMAVRNELGLNDHKIVGMVARFDPAKDHKNFFEAAKLILKSMPEVKFVLAGRGIDRKNRDLLSFLDSEQLSESTYLLGERYDISNINNCFDLACLSSYMEAFPNVIGEAMACGIPCVSTDVGDVRTIIGDNGFVVPSRSPVELAEAVIRFFEKPLAEQKRMGERAAQSIITRFEIGKVVKRYESLYGANLDEGS